MVLSCNKAVHAHDRDALSRMTGMSAPRLSAHYRDAHATKVFYRDILRTMVKKEKKKEKKKGTPRTGASQL